MLTALMGLDQVLEAMRPEQATLLFDKIVGKFRQCLGDKVKTGIFGADMQIDQHNDGPITIVIDSEDINK